MTFETSSTVVVLSFLPSRTASAVSRQTSSTSSISETIGKLAKNVVFDW
jgi:hypothetical protein